jgi:hypothetical protein
MGRLLITFGVILIILGLLWNFFGKSLGRLPGDIVIKRESFTFYFPLATSIIISLALSAVLWFIRR